jgi:hypothetical protein
MARRKKHTKKHSRRRRGMHGLGTATSMIPTILGIAGGAIAAKYVSSKLLTNQSDTIKTVAPIAAGLGIAMFVKNPIFKSVGEGMIIGPVINMASSKLGIAGVDDSSMARIMENITVGEDVTVGEDITVGGVEIMDDSMYND